MENLKISTAFKEMADILAIQGKDTHRIRAYRQAAEDAGDDRSGKAADCICGSI